MSRARAKGTAAETAVVDYLRANFPHVERRAMRGANDQGDVAGIPGAVIEVKNHRTLDLAEWVDEAQAEKANGSAAFAAVWHKRRQKGSPADWYVTLTGADFLELLCGWAD